jgi:hypothetical protein
LARWERSDHRRQIDHTIHIKTMTYELRLIYHFLGCGAHGDIGEVLVNARFSA